MAVTGLDLVARVLRSVAPAPMYIGNLPKSSPDQAISIQDAGGTDSVRVIGSAVPRYIVDRVLVQVRDKDEDSEHDNLWPRSTIALLRGEIVRLRGTPPVSRVTEQLQVTPRQPYVIVLSTYPELWGRQVSGPRERPSRRLRSTVVWEAQFEIKYNPIRTRPSVTPVFFFAADNDVSRTEVTHQIASNVIPPSGSPGRTWVGGEVTFGVTRPTTIGPDEAFPDGAAQGPLAGGEAALRWRNTSVATGRAPGGRFELFDTTSTNQIPIDAGGLAMTRFDSAEVTPRGIELKFNRPFSSEFERTGAFYLQQSGRPATPERFVFELSSASPPEDRGGEYVYTFPFDYQVGGQEVWNWGFGLTTEFLGVATQTTPPNNPRFSVVWQATWEDGTEIVRDTYTIPRGENPQGNDDNLRRIQLPATVSQRPEGGTITQTLTLVDQTPGFNRLQAYRTSLEFSGKVIYGEHEVTEDVPEPAPRQAFHPGFDSGFE